jgi:hypothetical protein
MAEFSRLYIHSSSLKRAILHTESVETLASRPTLINVTQDTAQKKKQKEIFRRACWSYAIRIPSPHWTVIINKLLQSRCLLGSAQKQMSPFTNIQQWRRIQAAETCLTALNGRSENKGIIDWTLKNRIVYVLTWSKTLRKLLKR